MKISVLTPTIRPDGLDIVRESLMRQTMKGEFEWLVEIGIGGHDLNAAYNRMLKRAKGELIVSLQDYTRILNNGLEKFWNAYQAQPRTFWTAPHGKVDDFSDPNARWDWRAYADAKPRWETWEIDWGCAPKAALFEVGGFDESLDAFWSCDNLNVGCRADIVGYTFGNLVDNPAVAIDHDKKTPHPFRKDYYPEYNNKRMLEFRQGLKIDYLVDKPPLVDEK